MNRWISALGISALLFTGSLALAQENPVIDSVDDVVQLHYENGILGYDAVIPEGYEVSVRVSNSQQGSSWVPIYPDHAVQNGSVVQSRRMVYRDKREESGIIGLSYGENDVGIIVRGPEGEFFEEYVFEGPRDPFTFSLCFDRTDPVRAFYQIVVRDGATAFMRVSDDYSQSDWEKMLTLDDRERIYPDNITDEYEGYVYEYGTITLGPGASHIDLKVNYQGRIYERSFELEHGYQVIEGDLDVYVNLPEYSLDLLNELIALIKSVDDTYPGDTNYLFVFELDINKAGERIIDNNGIYINAEYENNFEWLAFHEALHGLVDYGQERGLWANIDSLYTEALDRSIKVNELPEQKEASEYGIPFEGDLDLKQMEMVYERILDGRLDLEVLGSYLMPQMIRVTKEAAERAVDYPDLAVSGYLVNRIYEDFGADAVRDILVPYLVEYDLSLFPAFSFLEFKQDSVLGVFDEYSYVQETEYVGVEKPVELIVQAINVSHFWPDEMIERINGLEPEDQRLAYQILGEVYEGVEELEATSLVGNEVNALMFIKELPYKFSEAIGNVMKYF